MRKHILMPFMISLVLSACATNDAGHPRQTTRTEKITAIAPVSDSARDTVIQHKNRGKAALISAVGGGLANGDVSAYMDQQAKDLQRQLQLEIDHGDVTIEKRSSDNALLVSMSSTAHFDNLSSVIKPGYLASLNKIASVLNQYGKTLLTVIGYTDKLGADAGNQRLSERRAQSVVDYFTSQNINPLRLQSYGLPKIQARADDSADVSRPLNRRIELWVQPVTAQ